MIDNRDDSGRQGEADRREDPRLGAIRSRRDFLKKSSLAAAVPAMVGGAATAAGAATATRGTANFLSGYNTLPLTSDPNWLKYHILNILNDENTHLVALTNVLGAFQRPRPTFQNLEPANVEQFLSMGSSFCATGAGAYLGALQYIQNPAILNQAASIGAVEQAQSAYLNSILDLPFVSEGSPFGIPLTQSQVIFNASPYIASLNGGPAFEFSTTEMSLENDIAIVNFALVLEYLENTFYNTYYPKFFP